MGGNPSVSVIIPWQAGNSQDRVRNRDYVVGLWSEHFPEWEKVISPLSALYEWNKGLAVHQALRESYGDIIIMADADVWLGRPERLHHWVDLVHREGKWAVPHTKVVRLSEETTRKVIEDGLDWHTGAVHLARSPYVGVEGGGMFVIRRTDFIDIGGIDHRFVGWGWEDECFGSAADTLLGYHPRGDDDLFHLYHRPHHTRAKPYRRVYQDGLRAQYLRLRNFHKPMRNVVDGLNEAKDKAMVEMSL